MPTAHHSQETTSLPRPQHRTPTEAARRLAPYLGKGKPTRSLEEFDLENILNCGAALENFRLVRSV